MAPPLRTRPWWERAIDRLLPLQLRTLDLGSPDAGGDLMRLASARMLIGTCTILALGGLLFMAVSLSVGALGLGVVFLLASLLGGLVPVLYARTGSTVIVGNFAALLAWVATLAIAYFIRDLAVHAAFAMSVVVVCAVLNAGWRYGALWLVLSVGGLALVDLTAVAPRAAEVGLGGAHLSVLSYAAVTLVLSMLTAMTGVSAAIRRDALRNLERANRSIARARERAEEVNRTKTMFFAKMSHEIRTPMNGILGMTDLALSTDLTDEQREYLSAVRSSGEGLLRILNDILDVSKLEAGRLALEHIPFGVRATVDQSIRVLGPLAARAGLELSAAVDDAVPERWRGDPGRLQQVLLNLVGNAIKFTREGSVRVTVTPCADDVGRPGIRFAVQDTGVGIDPGDQAHIFAPFAQARASLSPRSGGTGLGLSVARELVGLMGGALWLESELGRGSTFRFEVYPEPEGEVSARPRSGRLGRRLIPSSGPMRPRVLLVARHPVNALLLTRMLEASGHRVERVARAEEVPALLAGQRFDAAVVDLEDVAADGLEALRQLRSREEARARRAPILGLSTAPPEGQDAHGEAPVDDVLAKPVERDALARSLQRLMSRRAPG